MDDVLEADPELSPGEDPLDLLPGRLGVPVSRFSGLHDSGVFADTRLRGELPEATPLQRYVSLEMDSSFWDLGLPLGFSVPIGHLISGDDFSGPRPLNVGGMRPSMREQIDSVIHGQESGEGFNFLGMNVALPEWAASGLRTHTSATLVYLYRNEEETSWSRAAHGVLLDLIHPGYTELIDSETPYVRPTPPSQMDVFHRIEIETLYRVLTNSPNQGGATVYGGVPSFSGGSYGSCFCPSKVSSSTRSSRARRRRFVSR